MAEAETSSTPVSSREGASRNVKGGERKISGGLERRDSLMRARHRAFESPPGEPHTDSNGAPLSLSRSLPYPLPKEKEGEGKRRRKEPPTLSNPKQSRPGVQGVSTLLPSSGDRLGRRTLGRTGGGRSARRDVRATKRAKSLRELARRTRSIGNDPSKI